MTTFTLRKWNPKTQNYDPPREITQEQFRAEQDKDNAAARAIFRANVAKLRS